MSRAVAGLRCESGPKWLETCALLPTPCAELGAWTCADWFLGSFVYMQTFLYMCVGTCMILHGQRGREIYIYRFAYLDAMVFMPLFIVWNAFGSLSSTVVTASCASGWHLCGELRDRHLGVPGLPCGGSVEPVEGPGEPGGRHPQRQGLKVSTSKLCELYLLMIDNGTVMANE